MEHWVHHSRETRRHKDAVVHFKGKIIQVIEDSGQATQYRISVTPTDYGGWDEQVDDLPHVGLGGRTVLALQTTGDDSIAAFATAMETSVIKRGSTGFGMK